jgi:hypothetical protein
MHAKVKSARTSYDVVFPSDYMVERMIAEGMLKTLGLGGKAEFTDTLGLVRFELDEAMSPNELAKLIEEKCQIKHIRICGERDSNCKNLSFLLGIFKRRQRKRAVRSRLVKRKDPLGLISVHFITSCFYFISVYER